MKHGQQDLLLVLDTQSATPIYLQIYRQIASAIERGVLAGGDRLPSIRSLCRELDVSHITVEKAYLQLGIEGFVEAKPRLGYVVQDIDVEFFKHEGPDNRGAVEECLDAYRQGTFIQGEAAGRAARYDFSYYNLQPGSFPRRTWEKCFSEAMLELDDRAFSSYPPQGTIDAPQTEIARYLNRTRGLSCLPEQVVLHAGTEAALSSVLELFNKRTCPVGMEEPGYDVAVSIMRRKRFNLVPLPVGGGFHEAFIGGLHESGAKLAFVTPSHQFPTGAIMPMELRVKLLKWADRDDAYIIEDDSCSEYRYETAAIPALASMDTGNRVIYLGNFSKVLSPGLRIAYLVLPPQMLQRHYETFGYSFTDVPVLLRETLARFIAKGHLDQQVRKMTTGNRARHDLLLECLRREFGDVIRLSGIDSGMHLLAYVDNGMDTAELIARARAEGANVYSAESYWFESPAPRNCLMVGFSSIKLEDIPAGVAALKRAWG